MIDQFSHTSCYIFATYIGNKQSEVILCTPTIPGKISSRQSSYPHTYMVSLVYYNSLLCISLYPTFRSIFTILAIKQLHFQERRQVHMNLWCEKSHINCFVLVSSKPLVIELAVIIQWYSFCTSSSQLIIIIIMTFNVSQLNFTFISTNPNILIIFY